MSDTTGRSDTSRLAEMEAELAVLRAENNRLRGLLGFDARAAEPTRPWAPTLFADGASPATAIGRVDAGSSSADKVVMYRSLFAGREDVYVLAVAKPTLRQGWVSPAVRGGWANAKRPEREYLPFTDEVVERHLAGTVHAGLYPLLRGDTCRLVACDFDGPGGPLTPCDLDAARAAGIPAALERSQSGDGGHVWVFFAGGVPAAPSPGASACSCCASHDRPRPA